MYNDQLEVKGIKLMSYELAYHDKVLKVHIDDTTSKNEERTAFADEIEAEDLRLEEAKRSMKKNSCICS